MAPPALEREASVLADALGTLIGTPVTREENAAGPAVVRLGLGHFQSPLTLEAAASIALNGKICKVRISRPLYPRSSIGGNGETAELLRRSWSRRIDKASGVGVAVV